LNCGKIKVKSVILIDPKNKMCCDIFE